MSPTMSPRVVITDCDHPDVAIERRVFAKAGLAVVVAHCKSADDVVAAGEGAVALLAQQAPITAEVLERLPSCRVVGRYGTGLDNIDVVAAATRSVRVVSVPDYSVEEVSSHAVALVLALVRGITRLDASVHEGSWDFRAAGELRRLSALQLGVIGLGHIGESLARKVRSLGFSVNGFDVTPRHVEGVRTMGLDELLAASDIVSLHVPLTASTRHLLGDEELARMKQGAMLVNTSRGALIDEAALAHALAEGRLAGAALDVLEEEPPAPGNPLLADRRVLITPHAAFYSQESLAELKYRVADGIVDALEATANVG